MLILNEKKYNFKDRSFFPELTFSFFNSDYYLEKKAFVGEWRGKKVIFEKIRKKNGEKRIYLKNLPKKENLSNLYFKDLSKDDLDFLKESYDIKLYKKYTLTFFYNKKKFLEKGHDSYKFRKFERKNRFKILKDYNFEQIIECFEEWKNNIEAKGRIAKKNTYDILESLRLNEKYFLKRVFMEIDNKLVGFSFGISYFKNKKGPFLSLFSYSLYQPRDIQYYLKIKRAELFESDFFLDFAFSLTDNVGLYKKENFKEEKVEYYYLVEVGEKKVKN